MFTKLRVKIASVGVVAGLGLASLSATPAAAATKFWAYMDGYHSYGEIYYHYDRCNSAGYCHITVTSVQLKGLECGDNWIHALTMYYTTSVGPWERGLAETSGCSTVPGISIDGTGYKDVWFELRSVDAISGAGGYVRLHK